MSERSFTLRLFDSSEPLPPRTISVGVWKRPDVLAVRYDVAGCPADLEIPPRADRPSRRDRLWQETCFEIFVACRGGDRYWEVNLSPAGHWNVHGRTAS